MKHTQGKWEVRNPKIKSTSYIDNIIVGRDDSGAICGNVATCRTEANANLIASAPEMLEALKMIAEYCDRILYSPKIKKLCKDLIAKAEGGAK